MAIESPVWLEPVSSMAKASVQYGISQCPAGYRPDNDQYTDQNVPNASWTITSHFSQSCTDAHSVYQ